MHALVRKHVHTRLRTHKRGSSINGNNICIFISKTALPTKLELINIYEKEGCATEREEMKS